MACYTSPMRNTAKFLAVGVFACLLVTQAAGQAPVPAPPPQNPQQPTFRVNVDLVTTDVIVRDTKTDQFISDLKAGEFEVYEDGVKQDIASLVLVNGGRVFNVQAPPRSEERRVGKECRAGWAACL